MNKVFSSEKLPVYQVIGPIVRVHWDYISSQTDEDWGESTTVWEAQEAVVSINADRSTFVSLINEAGGDGEILADGWFNLQ